MLEVREVHYLLVEAVPSGYRCETDRLKSVPRGGKLELRVSRREFSDTQGGGGSAGSHHPQDQQLHGM